MGAEPLRVIEGGGPPRGWKALWRKDAWGQLDLPHGDLASMYRGEEFIRFERIGQLWLKEATKRWARARLLADTAPRTMSSYVVGICHFSEWLAQHAAEVSAPSSLSRSVLEDYMLWVRHGSPWKPATRIQRLLSVRLLLEEQREDGLAGLPVGAVIHPAELPRVDPGLPKTLPGEVFAQWIDPAKLALLDEQDRTIVLVLAFTGFRVSSVVTLMRKCLELGSGGHPYLRYFNVKSSREAMLPIPPLLAEQLRRQEAFPAERYPDTEWIFPSRLRRGAKRGAFHIHPSSVANTIERYVRRAEMIARAKQALPNGYCGLPLVQSCRHPNACLSCESFLTDGSFRAVHEQQQAETRKLPEKARKQGSLRLIEVLERDEQSLARILEGLETIEADHAHDGADELDLRDLARGEQDEA